MSKIPLLAPALTEADHEFLAPLFNARYGEKSPYDSTGKLRTDIIRYQSRLLDNLIQLWVFCVDSLISGRLFQDEYADRIEIRTAIERVRKIAPPDLRARIDFWVLPADARFERATRKTRKRQNYMPVIPNEFTPEETWFQYRYPKVVQPFDRPLSEEELAKLAKIKAAADKAASPPWYPIRPESYAAAMEEWERRAR